MKKPMAGDFLIYDKSSNTYRTDPEQLVRDDVEKHYWKNVVRTVLKDWRLYVMLIPMLLVFKNGQVAGKSVGYTGKQAIVDML